MSKLESAVAAYNEATLRMTEVADEIEALDENATDEDLDALEKDFDEAKAEVERAGAVKDRYQRITDARDANPVIQITDPPSNGSSSAPVEARFTVGAEEPVYRQHGGPGFFHDVIKATLEADSRAAERLAQHQDQVEERDLTTTATAGGGFVPPIYMGELFADIARPARPFADVFPSRPLPPAGMVISIPRITTGPAVAIMASENSSVNEVDLVETTLTVNVRTIAGQQDISQQLLDRSDPSIDSIVFGDLRSSYDQTLDVQMLSGTGSGALPGIRGVSGVNTVSYSSGTPTAAALLPKLYDAVQKIHNTRYAPPDTIVMHPRRSAWLASQLSSTFPLFQQGTLTQAAGTQDAALLTSFAGMRVVHDPSIGTLYGAGTNEDEIYVLRAADLILWEGPLQARVLPEVLSGTLTVRVQLFGYAAFASGRYPASITIISGTGLVAPTF
jgi:HK97 family phage major capsid protein